MATTARARGWRTTARTTAAVIYITQRTTLSAMDINRPILDCDSPSGNGSALSSYEWSAEERRRFRQATADNG